MCYHSYKPNRRKAPSKMNTNLQPTWKLPFIALLGLVLLASSCNTASNKTLTAKDFEGLYYAGDTTYFGYEEAVPSKETRTWCSGTKYDKDICVSRHRDTTFVMQGKPIDAQMAADGWNARIAKHSSINWSKDLSWVPLALAILLGLLLLAIGLALLGVLRDTWNRFWQTSTSPATTYQPPTQAPTPAPTTASQTGAIQGNDQYFFSVPKGTRVEVQMGNGNGFVNNGDRPATQGT